MAQVVYRIGELAAGLEIFYLDVRGVAYELALAARIEKKFGVAFVPVFLGPEFTVDAAVAVSIVFAIELIAFILSPMLKTTEAAPVKAKGKRRKK